jgi:hypothetical protein
MEYLDTVGPPLIPLILAVSSLGNIRKCYLGSEPDKPFISLLMITLAVIQFGTCLALVIVAYLVFGDSVDMIVYSMWGLSWVRSFI